MTAQMTFSEKKKMVLEFSRKQNTLMSCLGIVHLSAVNLLQRVFGKTNRYPIQLCYISFQSEEGAQQNTISNY